MGTILPQPATGLPPNQHPALSPASSDVPNVNNNKQHTSTSNVNVNQVTSNVIGVHGTAPRSYLEPMVPRPSPSVAPPAPDSVDYDLNTVHGSSEYSQQHVEYSRPTPKQQFPEGNNFDQQSKSHMVRG